MILALLWRYLRKRNRSTLPFYYAAGVSAFAIGVLYTFISSASSGDNITTHSSAQSISQLLNNRTDIGIPELRDALVLDLMLIVMGLGLGGSAGLAIGQFVIHIFRYESRSAAGPVAKTIMTTASILGWGLSLALMVGGFSFALL